MVNLRTLSPELQKKAIDELFEDPNRIEKDLEAFRDWIKKSPHLNGKTDDQFLIAFLRGCKYSLEKAKQKYDLHYTLKTHLPDVMKNRDPFDENVKTIMNNDMVIILPKSKIPGSPRYIFARPAAFDPDKFTANDLLKKMTMVFDALMLEDDDFIVSGTTMAADASNVTLKILMVFNNPVTMKKNAMIQQDAYPIRLKASHIVNMPSIMVTLVNLFKSFLNEKNKSRIFVHGDDLEEFFKLIPKEILPKEYGGDGGTIQEILEENVKMMTKHRDFFIEDEKYGVDEKKRIGKPKNPETLFGVDGTFRQLQID